MSTCYYVVVIITITTIVIIIISLYVLRGARRLLFCHLVDYIAKLLLCEFDN